jgi:hypothetical protein
MTKRWPAFEALHRLTLVELTPAFSEGRFDDALERCTQTLPFFLDLTNLGLVGAMLGVSGVSRLAPSCAVALARATLPARQRAASA